VPAWIHWDTIFHFEGFSPTTYLCPNAAQDNWFSMLTWKSIQQAKVASDFSEREIYKGTVVGPCHQERKPLLPKDCWAQEDVVFTQPLVKIDSQVGSLIVWLVHKNQLLLNRSVMKQTDICNMCMLGTCIVFSSVNMKPFGVSSKLTPAIYVFFRQLQNTLSETACAEQWKNKPFESFHEFTNPNDTEGKLQMSSWGV